MEKGVWAARGGQEWAFVVKIESRPYLLVFQGSPLFLGGSSRAGLPVTDPSTSAPRGLAA